MKFFSSKRYLYICFAYLGKILFLTFLLLALSCIQQNSNLQMVLTIGIGIGSIFFLPPLIYYLVCLITYSKKAQTISPTVGVIENWQLGFYRDVASVAIKTDGKEYLSSAYFGANEARELVGTEITYCIIDETLFIFEISSQPSSDH